MYSHIPEKQHCQNSELRTVLDKACPHIVYDDHTKEWKIEIDFIYANQYQYALHLLSVFSWISLFQFRINLDNLIVNDGPEDLQAFDVHTNLSLPLSFIYFIIKST